MIAIASMGLSNWWHFVALGNLKQYLKSELLPRMIPLLLMLLFVNSPNNLMAYLVINILLNFVFCWIPLRNTFDNLLEAKWLSELAGRLTLTSWRILQSSYFLFGLPLLALINPAACFSYAIVERLYRFSMTATLPLQDYLMMRTTRRNLPSSYWTKVATTQTLFSLFIYGVLSVPFIFEGLVGIENPNQGLSSFFATLVLVVSMNRVFVIRYTKKYSGANHLKKIYLGSALCFLIPVFPAAYFWGGYGMVSCSIIAEIGFLLCVSETIKFRKAS
jgi:hypothetical protein